MSNTSLAALQEWVDEVAKHTQPDNIVWCDGSDEEYQRFIDMMLADGTLTKLNQEAYPNCYLHRSDPRDVARVEGATMICTKNEEDAGPNNIWMEPEAAHAKIDEMFAGCMQGRTMYVVPYCMGPIASPISRCGVEITDSPYVVANMKIMTRMGKQALERIEKEGTFVKGQHSTGELDPERRFIMHFPEELSIKSYGSGYGGNALLGKKCHALRIASYQAKDEGWLAEHMLILGITNPEGEKRYVAAAFPSACGKTNLAMLIPPESHKGWKIETIGDDIAWLNRGEDGRLYAINPEAGFFGVVPGTSPATNYNAYKAIEQNAIFTNVGVTADNIPYWEGKESGETPVINWKGEPMSDANKDTPAAHPNSRFTSPATNNPVYSPEAENPAGVPIDAIIFGGRRRELAPLVYEAKDWAHGVLVGAGVASEMTAAAEGQTGVVRRDPMAMKPFCGYNFGDYWAHWLSMAERNPETADKLPGIFHVNWFRRDKDGRFLWPGFGENLRVLSWILDRVDGKAEAHTTAIGHLPTPEALDTEGLDIAADDLNAILSIDKSQWTDEMNAISEFLDSFGQRAPERLHEEVSKVKADLAA